MLQLCLPCQTPAYPGNQIHAKNTIGKKKEKLQFKLDGDCVYLFCRDGNPYSIDNRMLYSILNEILTFIADTEEVDDAINDIMIALL